MDRTILSSRAPDSGIIISVILYILVEIEQCDFSLAKHFHVKDLHTKEFTVETNSVKTTEATIWIIRSNMSSLSSLSSLNRDIRMLCVQYVLGRC